MRKQNVDKFIMYLENAHLSRISPQTFTARGLVLFAHSKGFDFSIEDLFEKINEINNTPKNRHQGIEKVWYKGIDRYQRLYD